MKDKSIILVQLYHEYSYLMLHVAYKILQDQSLAEDAVHAAFLKLAKYDFEILEIKCKKTKSFLVTIVKNVAIDIYNKQKKLYFLDDKIIETADTSLPPLEKIASKDSLRILEETIDTMNPRYATVLKLRYLHDLPVEKIAEMLSITENNVYVRLHRARKILVSQLSKGDKKYEYRRKTKK
ncbi:MAG: sigma-70 family RNA polymerase sigma factor [Firmicutes bacterium]|nr:sigma-70 family RNA polymerase sigma factor [Bacillota bacterium]